MKVFILVFSSFLSYESQAALCLPDFRNVPKDTIQDKINAFEILAQDFEATFQPRIPNEYDLHINFEPIDPGVNAEFTKDGNQMTINILGGMLGHSLLSENSFKLLLCHEIGHFLGGEPYKARGGWSSTEGQADYYSGLSCAKFLNMDESSVMEGALELTQIYAQVTNQPPPVLGQCDNLRVTRTNFGYPSVQCRLESIIAGYNNAPRPNCWYFGN